MELENVLGGLSRELMTQRGRLLATPFPVIRTSHLVRPAVAIRDRKPNLAVREGGLEPRTVDAAGVHERVGYSITKHLLETAHGERITTYVPIRSRALRLREDLTALVSHQLVIDPTNTVTPRRVLRESTSRERVVVRDVYVVMQMPARRVSMRNDDVSRGMQTLGELHPQLMDTSDVGRGVDVELVRRERLHVVIRLHPPLTSFRVHDERVRGLLRGRQYCSARGTLGETPSRVSTTPVEGIHDRRPGRLGRLHIHSAHVLVRSPSAARTAVFAAIAPCRRSSSTTTPGSSPSRRAR